MEELRKVTFRSPPEIIVNSGNLGGRMHTLVCTHSGAVRARHGVDLREFPNPSIQDESLLSTNGLNTTYDQTLPEQ